MTSPCRLRAGRTDASQEWTDVESISWLEPSADGFRNYLRHRSDLAARPRSMLVDKAQLLTLTRRR